MEEYFDILNEDGTKTGRVKLRSLVHQDGDLHSGSHVWIYRRYNEKYEVLLQKRSSNKDSFPNCYDISSAGHIPAGEDYLTTAVRELEEELGIVVDKKELTFLFSQKEECSAIFYGKQFINKEISYVFALERNVNIGDLKLQAEEIQSVMWMDIFDVKKFVDCSDSEFCINKDEYNRLIKYITKNSIM